MQVEYTDSLIQKELEETLFIGINSNQPGSKTAVDRMKSISSEKPGVLGFAANTNENSNEFVGDFYYTVAYRLEFYSQVRMRAVELNGEGERAIFSCEESQSAASRNTSKIEKIRPIRSSSSTRASQKANSKMRTSECRARDEPSADRWPFRYAIPLMKQGVRESNGDKDIPLTVLAVQKMNNIRLFPKVVSCQLPPAFGETPLRAL